MGFRERIALGCYIGAMNVLLPLGILIALPVLLLKEKRRKTLFRRLGFQRFPMMSSGKRPVWVHALSLGETLSCVSLVEELREQLQDRPLLFSVSTLSAMQVASDRIRPAVDGVFYFPLDLWWPARRALMKVSPCLMVFIETDVWPGFQHQLRRTETPAVLVNARLSPDSYRACQRFSSLFAPALNTFRRIYPQSKTEGQRYLDVGVAARRIVSPGNLKFDVACRPPKPDEFRALRDRLGVQPSDRVLLAGSTHPGEEEMVLQAYRTVQNQMPDARLIIVPRHPGRADEVAALAQKSGWSVLSLTGSEKTKRWDVLVVDVMGVLSSLYHLAMVSFVGGSLVSKGGQNPLESAAAGCPVTFGPDMSDFPDIAKWLLEGGVAVQVSDGERLGEKWLELLADEGSRAQISEVCCRIMGEHQGATSLIAHEVAGLVSALDAKHSEAATQ